MPDLLTASPATEALVKTFQTRSSFLGESPRYFRLDKLDRYFRGTQHMDKGFEWDGTVVLPAADRSSVARMVQDAPGYKRAKIGIRQKRPDTTWNGTRIVVNRFTGLLFGESRKPVLSVVDDEQTHDFLVTIARESNLWTQAKIWRNYGGSIGTAVMLFGFRRGRPVYRALNPKFITPYWKDEDEFDLAAIDIQYRVMRPVIGKDNKLVELPHAYRRVVTDLADITFPLTVIGARNDVQWDIADPRTKILQHNFGFCPVVWVQNECNDISADGLTDCEGTYEEQDAIAQLLSQMKRGALANLDPTLVVKIEAMLIKAGLAKGSDHALNVGPQGDAKYLEISGGGFTVGEKLVEQLRKYLLEECRCVLADPDKITTASAQSGAAIKLLYAPMLERADELRENYGAGLRKLARITLDASRTVLKTPLVIDDKEIPQSIDIPLDEDSNAREPGEGEHVQLLWPQYFPPTEADRQSMVTSITAVLAAWLISRRTAMKMLAPYFEIDDIEAEMAEIEKEIADRERERAKMFDRSSEMPV